tara:strand:+ start:139 stop:1758 length:1620 start_codon:yes stop_codon:yes gene_type:complete
MDLSKLSDADLLALKGGDLSKLSNEGLISLQPTQAQPTQSEFAETSGGAAVGRPVRGVRLNVQPEPRPLESFMAGVTKSAIDPLLAGAQMVTGGRGGVSDAVKRLAQESQVYEEANPASYIGGRVGGAVLPAAGVAKGIGAIPSFARANPYVQGAGVGAITGAMTPVETGATGPQMYEQMGKNVATGGAIGTAIPVIGRGIQAAGGAIRRGLGLTTGAGEESISQALRAGREGNQAFLQNIRGDVSAMDVLDQAKDALANMRSARSQAYGQTIKPVMANQTKLDFAPITGKLDEVVESLKVKTPTGSQFKIGSDELRKVEELQGIVKTWQKDPALHTAEGLDALKQRLDALYPDSPMQKQVQRVVSAVRNTVKDTIVAQDKNYAKTMKAYEESLSLEREIERALSLNNRSAADTAIRKLQSLTRNNANTNYGYRLELAKALQEQGNQDLMPALAGQALSSYVPRGLAGQGAALGIGAGGALTFNPMAAAMLPLTSPKLVGMGAYGVGRATRNIPKLSDAELRNMARMLTTQGVQGAINE